MRKWFRRLRLLTAGVLVVLAVAALLMRHFSWNHVYSLNIPVRYAEGAACELSIDLLEGRLSTWFAYGEPEALNRFSWRLQADVEPLITSVKRGMLESSWFSFDAWEASPNAASPIRYGGFHGSLHLSLLALALLLLALPIGLGPLLAVRRRRYRMHSGLCLHCGYHLKGVKGGACPECGAERSYVTFHRGEARD